MNNIIKVVSVIIGSIIGAGFASGQEIKIFFANYGIYGILGIFISAIIMILVINLCFKIMLKNNIKNYNNFIEIVFEGKTILNDSVKNITNLFMMSCFFIMSIGFSSCIEQQFLIPRYIGGIIFSIICYISFIGNINRIIKINQYIMPILISVIIYAGLKGLISEDIYVNKNLDIRFILSSIIYASYNLLPLIPILASLNTHIHNKKQINAITVLTLLVIVISALAVFVITSIDYNYASDILLIEISKRWGAFEGIVFSIVILLAIFTSSICSGYGFARNIASNEKKYKRIILIISLLAIPISNLNFSMTIQIVYPFFGILGLMDIYYIIYNFLKK